MKRVGQCLYWHCACALPGWKDTVGETERKNHQVFQLSAVFEANDFTGSTKICKRNRHLEDFFSPSPVLTSGQRIIRVVVMDGNAHSKAFWSRALINMLIVS